MNSDSSHPRSIISSNDSHEPKATTSFTAKNFRSAPPGCRNSRPRWPTRDSNSSLSPVISITLRFTPSLAAHPQSPRPTVTPSGRERRPPGTLEKSSAKPAAKSDFYLLYMEEFPKSSSVFWLPASFSTSPESRAHSLGPSQKSTDMIYAITLPRHSPKVYART